MSFIKSLRKKLPDVKVIGHPATGPRFFYDEIPIMSLGIAYRFKRECGIN